MDIKVFNTNLIKFVLIFKYEWDHDEIILRSFTFLCFLLFTPEIQMKGAFLFFGNLLQAFPNKTIF